MTCLEANVFLYHSFCVDALDLFTSKIDSILFASLGLLQEWLPDWCYFRNQYFLTYVLQMITGEKIRNATLTHVEIWSHIQSQFQNQKNIRRHLRSPTRHFLFTFVSCYSFIKSNLSCRTSDHTSFAKHSEVIDFVYLHKIIGEMKIKL